MARSDKSQTPDADTSKKVPAQREKAVDVGAISRKRPDVAATLRRIRNV